MFYLPRFVILVLSVLGSLEHAAGKCIPSKCSDPKTCILSEDGTSCKCAAGYFGDQCDQAVTINVMCGKDSIGIAVIEDYFKYYNVDVGAVYLTNPECRARKELIGGIVYYTVRTPKDKYDFCGGEPVVKNISHVTYSLTMMSDWHLSESIVREPVIKIRYKCIYPFIRMVSMQSPILPVRSETVIRVDRLEANVEMSLYSDERYVEVFAGLPTVQFRDRVFVQVSVSRPHNFFNLRVDECWATQTPNPNDTASLSHRLLMDGCAEDDTVSFITKAITYRNGTMEQGGQNGVSSTVRFSFEVFRFIAAPHELYLHCIVHLCAHGHGDACIPECKSITKRAATSMEPLESLVSYGPIRLEVPEQPKSSLVYTLMLPLAAVWILGLLFFVLILIAKAGNKPVSSESPS